MPRDRVVLTREPDTAGRPAPTPEQQAEYNRIFRRGFIFVALGALFDVAAVVLILLGNLPAGVALAAIGILISIYAGREFGRAGRTVEAMRQRGY
jgi:TRADD-N domain-containing protein